MNWRKMIKKGVTFIGLDGLFAGDGSNPAFGGPTRTTADELWGVPAMAELERLALQHPLAARCVRILSTGLLEAPTRVGRRTGRGWTDLETVHPVLRLLDNPNQAMTWSDLARHMVGNYLASGAAYVWKWRTTGGKLWGQQPSRLDGNLRHEVRGELWPVPASWVRLIPGQGRELVDHYELRVPGRGGVIRVAPNDLFAWREPDFRDLTGASSPLKSIYRNLRLDFTAEDYLAETLVNSRLPGVKVIQRDGFTDTQKEEIRAVFDERFGVGRRGRPIFIEGEQADIQTLPALEDLGQPNLSAYNETRICLAFGVPPILAGCWVGLRHSPWSNIGEARKTFSQYTLIPLWLSLGEALTRGLLRQEGEPELEVYFHTGDVAALQPDLLQNAERAAKLAEAGIATREQAAVVAGLEVPA